MATNSLKDFYPFLKQCRFLEGVSEDAYDHVLLCLQAKPAHYASGSTLQEMGMEARQAGLVISGNMEVYFYDELYNEVLVSQLDAGELYGVELACSRKAIAQTTIRAKTDCTVLQLNFHALLAVQKFHCVYREQISANLLQYFAEQTVFLNQRLRIVSQKRLRDKLKLFLQAQPKTNGVIYLTMKRNELAEYLHADRSAVSRELRRMEDDHLISVHGNKIQLLQDDYLVY